MPDTPIHRHITTNLTTLNATLVGRAFEVQSEAGRHVFADWLLTIVDRLGLEIVAKEEEDD